MRKVLKNAPIIVVSSFSKRSVCVTLATAWASLVVGFSSIQFYQGCVRAASFWSVVIGFSRCERALGGAKFELKLNNYREGLNGIFHLFSVGDLKTINCSDLVHSKFSQLLCIIDKDGYYGVEGKFIMDYFTPKEGVLYYNNWDEIRRKIEFFLEKMKGGAMVTNINGPIGVLVQGGEFSGIAEVNQIFDNKIEYGEIIGEVDKLKKYLCEVESTDDNHELIKKLEELEKASDEKDNDKIIKIIKSCGKKIIDISEKVAVPVLISLISKLLGP